MKIIKNFRMTQRLISLISAGTISFSLLVLTNRQSAAIHTEESPKETTIAEYNLDEIIINNLITKQVPSIPILSEKEQKEKEEEEEKRKQELEEERKRAEEERKLEEERKAKEEQLKEQIRKRDALLQYFDLSQEEMDNFINLILEHSINWGELGNGFTCYEDVVDAFYPLVNMKAEEKIKYITEVYDVTKEELDVVVACGVSEAEGDGNKYIDPYGVATTIYDRAIDAAYVRSTKGGNIYDIITSPNQFSVYSSGSYKAYLGTTETRSYNAILDMFYLGAPIHDSKEFRSTSYPVENNQYFKLTDNGNRYLLFNYCLLTPEKFYDNPNVARYKCSTEETVSYDEEETNNMLPDDFNKPYTRKKIIN